MPNNETAMTQFDFFSVPHIVFGRGQLARLPELAVASASSPMKRCLVVHNVPAQTLQRIAEALAAANLSHTPIRQPGEPTVADVDRALELARQEACDLVLGIGGGSAIDAAKATAGLLSNGGSALDYMEVVGKGQKIARPAVPWIAIPCTAGTGAEATRNAVIGYPEKAFKASLRSEHLLPRVALIDPELSIPVPPDVTARTGMDALCQCIEAYTSTGANPLTDTLALEGITRAARSLERAYLNGADLDAREDMALAALNSGIALANAGLGAVHGFAAPLGASFPVPHGTVCAALLAPVMAANVEALRAAGGGDKLARYATIGRRLIGRSEISDEEAIQESIAFVQRLCEDLKIPRLGQFGITPVDVNRIVTLAQKSSSMKFNPVVLPAETLRQVLTSAL
jgi:alcohol dehydrogenase class IV